MIRSLVEAMKDKKLQNVSLFHNTKQCGGNDFRMGLRCHGRRSFATRSEVRSRQPTKARR
jgi:methylphosphotriester-DNA--protein-cysteine methyltransferase